MSSPVLFHDGCSLCLQIAGAMSGIVPGLRIVDLALQPEAAEEAGGFGIRDLPCLVIDGKPFAINPHSKLGEIHA